MSLIYFCSIILALIAVSQRTGVTARVPHIPTVFELVESAKAERYICQIGEPCYFGYVKIDTESEWAKYRAMQTW